MYLFFSSFTSLRAGQPVPVKYLQVDVAVADVEGNIDLLIRYTHHKGWADFFVERLAV